MNKLAAVARGDIPADFVIRNARIANVCSGEYELSDVAVYSGKVAGISSGYEGRITFDAEGRVLIPSMIDGHVHIEDTMMTPDNFAYLAAKHGTGTVLADPHEIANTLGMAGLEYMFRASQGLPIDIFYGAPSCVPASDLETPYQELDMSNLRDMFSRGLVQHLGEMMNFPAVIAGDSESWGKILAAGNVPLTGHAPGVSGKSLNAYLSSGIDSDHECTTLAEAREKLSRGMWLMIREGASFRDLRTLLPIIKANPLNAARCMAVSDDITARYLLEIGHMDEKMRIMLGSGIDPFVALRMVTLTPAEYFRLYDRGAITPGKLADFALLDADVMDEGFRVSEVWKNGRLVMRDSDVFTRDVQEQAAPLIRNKVTHIPSVKDIRVPLASPCLERSLSMNVIGVTEGTVITQTLQIRPRVIDGFAVQDSKEDIAKIVVLERHNDTGRFGVGFVKGLSIRQGALGSSVAHDAHNFVVAGMDDESIISALHALADMGGGLVCTLGEEVKASFALPIGGLMSTLNAEQVCENLTIMEDTAESLGVNMPHPFMVLSFLCLSVIPELRITDLGYVDITKGGKQPVFVR